MPDLIHNPTHCKLGKKAPVFDKRVPSIQKLMGGAPMPPVPSEETRWQSVRTWILGENDTIGDCTAVGAANIILNASTAAGKPMTLTDAEIVAFYSACTGYNPTAALVNGENPTDQGGVESDVLARWATTGIADGAEADKLLGYASIDGGNVVACKQAMFLFGGLYIGLALPLAAQSLDVWDLPLGQPATGNWAPGSWGGHCVAVPGYEKDGEFTCITWGKPKVITRRFWRAYVDETWVPIDTCWLAANGRDPNGFSRAQLAAYMHNIQQECRTRIRAKADSPTAPKAPTAASLAAPHVASAMPALPAAPPVDAPEDAAT